MKTKSRQTCFDRALAGAAVAGMAALSVPAHAIQFEGDRYAAVLGSTPSECVQGGSSSPPAVVCADSTASSFSGSIHFIDPPSPNNPVEGTGATKSWAMTLGSTAAQMDLSLVPSVKISPYYTGQNGSNFAVGYAFNDYLLSGPAGPVNVTVTITLNGTMSRNYGGGGYQFGSTQFSAGTRNPAARADPGRLDALTGVAFLTGPSLNALSPGNPVANNAVATGTFSVMAGTAFEFGYELRASMMNADVHMNTSMVLSAPVGYTLAMVTPVPEPEAWAMLLAGLGLLGAAARRNWNQKGC